MPEHNNARAALNALMQAGRGEQFGLNLGEDDEPLEDMLGLPGVAAAQAEARRGNAGKGRVKGSHNRRTTELINYVERRYGSPIELLMQMARAPVPELARELQCSRLDAYKTKQSAAIAVVPFLHPRLASFEVLPPGAPGGEPSPLILVQQPDAFTITDAVVEEIAAEPAAVPAEGATAAAMLSSDEDEVGNTSADEIEAERPRPSTLRLVPQGETEAVVEEIASQGPAEPADDLSSPTTPLRISTLTLAPWGDGAPNKIAAEAGQVDSVGDQVVEAAMEVDAVVDSALDALETLLSDDPEQARQIRARLAAMLG